ncbi:GlxA family transcriptional regulator [Halomonas salifodinae]|uniref:GlxA family transcriptional regulator n=1 Tax=Halomonas salifodinae TaxID=438745 RepID=A0ABW2F2K6_9GAMM
MSTSFKSLLKRKNLAHLPRDPSGDASAGARRATFVLLEHFSLMAFTGAVDALVTSNLVTREPLTDVRTLSLGGEVVVSDLGIAISVDGELAELEMRRDDLLILCGGLRVHLDESPALRAPLVAAQRAGVTLGALWNGAYFLADAGLLDDHECAIHPDSRALMIERFPRVKVSRHSHVLDGQRISCAGANSSLNMMLGWLRHNYDAIIVDSVEEILSCDKSHELLGASVLSVDSDPTLPQPLKLALELMHSNIEEPLSLDEVARWAGLSRRQLERLFSRHVDASPSRYYLELRLTRARQLLQQTNRPIAEIAVASGFVSITHFRHCFRKFFHVAPGRFRRRHYAK